MKIELLLYVMYEVIYVNFIKLATMTSITKHIRVYDSLYEFIKSTL